MSYLEIPFQVFDKDGNDITCEMHKPITNIIAGINIKYPELLEYKETGIIVNDQGEVLSEHKVYVAKTGYKVIKVNSFYYCIHRMVAELFLPNPNNNNIVDHINNDRCDNRVENLRWCSKGENGKNKKVKNEYGLNGIYKIPDKFKPDEFVFKAVIGFNNKPLVIGYYKQLENAKQARIQKEIELYGNFSKFSPSKIEIVIEQTEEELEAEFVKLISG